MQSNSTQNWQKIADLETLARIATTAALSGNWEESIKINQKILNHSPSDIEALNRLARAQMCMGLILNAQKTYKKVLGIDPYNIIAAKNFEKLSKSNNNNHSAKQKNIAENLVNLFISEPGRTKVINLLNLAQPSILAGISYGEKLSINSKSHSITLHTIDGIYLGALPDDLAHRLNSFIGGGNKYEAYVKAISPKTLTVFIKEISRSEKFINQPSFQNSQYSSYFSE